MSKPATAGPWLQATSRSGVPAARPWRPGTAFRPFKYPLDPAVQGQDQVRCHARMECQQHYRESEPGQSRHRRQPENPFRPRKGCTRKPGHKPGRPGHSPAKSAGHRDQGRGSPRRQDRQGNRGRAKNGHRHHQRRGQHIRQQGVSRELRLQKHNDRTAQKLRGQRHGEPRRHPARHDGRSQVHHPLADHNDSQGGQDRQQKPETGSQSRLDQQKPDHRQAKKAQSSACSPSGQ